MFSINNVLDDYVLRNNIFYVKIMLESFFFSVCRQCKNLAINIDRSLKREFVFGLPFALRKTKKTKRLGGKKKKSRRRNGTKASIIIRLTVISFINPSLSLLDHFTHTERETNRFVLTNPNGRQGNSP